MSQPPVAMSVDNMPKRPTNAEIDQQIREFDKEYARQNPRAGHMFPWYDVWITAVTQPNVDSYNALRFDPSATVTRASLWLVGAGVAYGLLVAILGILNPDLFVELNAMQQTGELSNPMPIIVVSLLCAIPLLGLLNLLSAMISVGLAHTVATLMGGRGKFSDLLYLYAAFSVPMQVAGFGLGLIPVVGACLGLPLAFYNIYLYIIALRSVYDIDGLRAFGVLVGMFMVGAVFACLFYVLFGSLLMPYMPTY
jgi:hypothetical protein